MPGTPWVPPIILYVGFAATEKMVCDRGVTQTNKWKNLA